MKTPRLIIVLGLIAIGVGLFLPLTAHAQEVNLSSLDAEPNRVHVTTGAEYGLVAGMGYTRVLPFLDRQIVLSGEATMPWAGIDLSDYRIRASALVPIVGTDHWKIASALAPILRGTRNDISRMTNVGVDASLIGGYYTRRWFAAAEVGVDLALSTHIDHSDDYRMTVHADAKDGWYGNAGGNLRAGVQAGVAFGRHDITMRAGQVRDVDGAKPMLPIYATLSFDARW